jgi:two-component system, cell cycle response regulator
LAGSRNIPLEKPNIAVAVDPAINPSVAPGRPMLSSRPAAAPNGHVKILIADDDRLSRETTQKATEGWGYDVRTVRDGGAAFSALLEPNGPRLALLDWEMPGLSGIDVCRLLRARGDGPYVYVLLCTSKEGQRHLIDGLSAGADDYFRKPIDLQELEVRLRAGRRIVLLQDQLLEAKVELERRALYDSLTHVMNRGAILEVLHRELARSERSRKPISVALVDLDFFKIVNDNHGHPAGDAVLREFARRAKVELRAKHEVGRYGGEEFIIVFPECGFEEARLVCERIRERMELSPVDLPSKSAVVTTSIGLASTELGYLSAEGLISAADEALYCAKACGRNRTIVVPLITPEEEAKRVYFNRPLT